MPTRPPRRGLAPWLALWCTGGLALAGLAVNARADEPVKPTAPASEANPAVPAAGHSVHGEAFDDGPRRRGTLMAGQGKVDFPITTSVPEAQAFVNQGVAQLHSFFYLEAERSFRQASQLDPASPIPFWGMAMANVNNAKRAKGFLKEAAAKAKAMGPKLSRRETLYLDALQAFHKDSDDAKTRGANMVLTLETIVQEFPADLDARAWLAMITWQNEGMAGIGSRQAVDTLIDSVLDREPMHPGAHHYRIHLWDGAKFARAEPAAAMYARTAPGIAHAWHMPGHTYTNMKRYGDAAYQQEGSARVDHAYMARERVMPFEIHNYAHNNQWLSTSLAHVGRARESIAVARNLVEQPRDPRANGPNDGGSPQRSGRLRWSEALLKYELWDELIAANATGALDWTEIPMEQVEKHRGLGLAHAGRGDLAKLDAEIAALRPLVERPAPAKAEPAKPEPTKEPAKPGTPAPPAAETAPPTPPAPAPAPASTEAKPAGGVAAAARRMFGGNAGVSALAELEGHAANLRGDYPAVIEKFAKATAMRPESAARAHLAAKNVGMAEAAARKGADSAPGQYVPLATLVEVLAAAGKLDEAKAKFLLLEPIARGADRDTPIARRLEPIVAPWRSKVIEAATEPATAARVDLETVGPLGWSPTDAPAIELADTEGKPWSLAGHKGRNVVVLFFLGGKCPHCMQQLQDFGKELKAFEAIDTDVVAVSTDDLEASRTLKHNAEGVKFPMAFLPDPKLDRFRAFAAFDDFEAAPLHGAFLVDGDGKVRFQRISAEPFLDVEFLKKEAARVNVLRKNRAN